MVHTIFYWLLAFTGSQPLLALSIFGRLSDWSAVSVAGRSSGSAIGSLESLSEQKLDLPISAAQLIGSPLLDSSEYRGIYPE